MLLKPKKGQHGRGIKRENATKKRKDRKGSIDFLNIVIVWSVVAINFRYIKTDLQ